MHMGACRMETLAEGGGCRVDRCTHGWVHLTMGAVTVRLHPDHCLALSQLLETATPALAGLRSDRAQRVIC